MAEIPVGTEVRKILTRELGGVRLSEFEIILRSESIDLTRMEINDLLRLSQLLSRNYRTELGFEKTQQLTKRLQKIRPERELARLRAGGHDRSI